MTTRDQMRGGASVAAPSTDPEESDTLSAQLAAIDVPDIEDDEKGFELDNATGDWMYTLQHPPEPLGTKAADPMAPPFRIRVSSRIYGKHIRVSTTRGGGNDALTMFHLIASMCALPETWLDRLDARDYGALSAKVASISKNARTATAS